jgi:hypothetical protein
MSGHFAFRRDGKDETYQANSFVEKSTKIVLCFT